MSEEISITKKCPSCQQYHVRSFDKQQFDKWRKGELIQNAMPNESLEVREFLITGLCIECQKEIFGE